MKIIHLNHLLSKFFQAMYPAKLLNLIRYFSQQFQPMCPVKKPKLTQSALSVIKIEGTASCFFAPRQKKSEEQTKVVDSADLSAAVEMCGSPEKKFELTPEGQAILNSLTLH